MEGPVALLLFGAGLAGGVVTAIVGGASLITFPALLAAGLPAIIANASNAVALTPANLVAGLGDLERWPRWDRFMAGLCALAVAGSVAGATLLLLTPEKAFTALVPVLIGAATVLFALSDRIRRRLAARAARGVSAHRQGAHRLGLGLVGGFLGGRLARVVPARLARGVVIAVGAVLTVVYAWRYW